MSPAQIGMEGRSQGIAMPLGFGDMLAGAPHPGVIKADDDAFEFMGLNGVLENRVKEPAWLPGRAGEDPVIGGPIFLGIAVEPNGPGNGAFTHAAQNAKGHGAGALAAAMLGKDRIPLFNEFKECLQEFHEEPRVVGNGDGAL